MKKVALSEVNDDLSKYLHFAEKKLSHDMENLLVSSQFGFESEE